MKTMLFGLVGLLAVLLVPSIAQAQSAGKGRSKGGCCCKKRGEGHGLGQRERRDGDRTGLKDEAAHRLLKKRHDGGCDGDRAKGFRPERKGDGDRSGLKDRLKKHKEHGNNGVGNGQDPQPLGNPPVNDGPGTGPGNPGNK